MMKRKKSGKQKVQLKSLAALVTPGKLKRKKRNTASGWGCLILLLVIGGALAYMGGMSSNQRAESTTAVTTRRTATPANTRQPTRTPQPVEQVQTYTVMSNANLRSCAQTTCEVVSTMPSGELINVVGEERGTTVSGSSLWYMVRLQNGSVGYIHSSLAQSGVRTVVRATSVPGSGGSSSGPPAGPTAFSCPRNCTQAREMGLTAEQAATCPGLDRDGDGKACYDDN